MMMLLVIGFVFGQEVKEVSRFNVAPLKPGGVHGEQELMSLLNKEKEAIAIIFNGQNPLIEAFYDQMFGVAIWYKEFPTGSEFFSMTYRSWDKKTTGTGRWRWIGEKSFNAYVIAIEYATKRYWLVIPEQCGNIGLWKIETIEIEEEIPEPKIQEYPSRSINKQLLQPEPKLEPSAHINYFAGVGVGEFISCREPYILFEAGAMRHISKSIDMVMSIGASLPIGEDKANWYTVPIIGIGLQAKFLDPFYLGVEVGLSGKMKEGLKTQIEFGGEFGFWVKNTMTIYLRARAPFDEKIGWNYKIIIGIRIFF
jgi:hypothetical protein